MSAQGYQDNGSAMHQNDNFFTYWGGDGMDCAVDPTDDKYVFGSYIKPTSKIHCKPIKTPFGSFESKKELSLIHI